MQSVDMPLKTVTFYTVVLYTKKSTTVWLPISFPKCYKMWPNLFNLIQFILHFISSLDWVSRSKRLGYSSFKCSHTHNMGGVWLMTHHASPAVWWVSGDPSYLDWICHCCLFWGPSLPYSKHDPTFNQVVVQLSPCWKWLYTTTLVAGFSMPSR